MRAKLLLLIMLCLLLAVNVWADTLPAPAGVIVPPESQTGTFAVSWTGVAFKGVQYEVQEAVDAGPFTTLVFVKATKINLKGRLAGHAYRYQIRAKLAGYEDSAWVSGNNDCDVPYVVAVKKTAGGEVTLDGKATTKEIIPVGATRTVAVTPAEGFHIVSVVVGGVTLVSDSTKADDYAYSYPSAYTFSIPENLVDNPKNKHALAVKFAANSYTVMAEAGAGGKITPAGEKAYKYGKQAKYTIKPNKGYRIESIILDGNPYSFPPTGAFTFYLQPGFDKRVSVTFAPIGPPPKVLTGLSIYGGTQVSEGTTLPLTATAVWSDSSTSDVTTFVTWNDDSAVVSVSGGAVTAGQVASDTPVTITVSYTFNGVTKTKTHGVTIKNLAPACTDTDGDGYAIQGGSCGVVDCDDANSSIRPGANEICGDGFDQDCSGSDLICQPALMIFDQSTFDSGLVFGQ